MVLKYWVYFALQFLNLILIDPNLPENLDFLRHKFLEKLKLNTYTVGMYYIFLIKRNNPKHIFTLQTVLFLIQDINFKFTKWFGTVFNRVFFVFILVNKYVNIYPMWTPMTYNNVSKGVTSKNEPSYNIYSIVKRRFMRKSESKESTIIISQLFRGYWWNDGTTAMTVGLLYKF